MKVGNVSVNAKTWTAYRHVMSPQMLAYWVRREKQILARRARHESRQGIKSGYAVTGIRHQQGATTHGTGPDVGYVYSGAVAPWAETLGEYRPFTSREILDQEVCAKVSLNQK